VAKPSRYAGFSQETFPCFGVGRNASVDDLERHLISQDRVEGLKGDSHRASAQLYRRAIGVDSDLVMVKLFRVCYRDLLLVKCQFQQASYAPVYALSNAPERGPALPADQLGIVG
jgi:hypothetical protein